MRHPDRWEEFERPILEQFRKQLRTGSLQEEEKVFMKRGTKWENAKTVPYDENTDYSDYTEIGNHPIMAKAEATDFVYLTTAKSPEGNPNPNQSSRRRRRKRKRSTTSFKIHKNNLHLI